MEIIDLTSDNEEFMVCDSPSLDPLKQKRKLSEFIETIDEILAKKGKGSNDHIDSNTKIITNQNLNEM